MVANPTAHSGTGTLPEGLGMLRPDGLASPLPGTLADGAITAFPDRMQHRRLLFGDSRQTLEDGLGRGLVHMRILGEEPRVGRGCPRGTQPSPSHAQCQAAGPPGHRAAGPPGRRAAGPARTPGQVRCRVVTRARGQFRSDMHARVLGQDAGPVVTGEYAGSCQACLGRLAATNPSHRGGQNRGVPYQALPNIPPVTT